MKSDTDERGALRWHLVPVAPTGSTTALDPGGPVKVPTYPRSPEGDGLRALRLRCGLSIGDAARLLGLTLTEYSGLETGQYVAVNLDGLRAALVGRAHSEVQAECFLLALRSARSQILSACDKGFRRGLLPRGTP